MSSDGVEVMQVRYKSQGESNEEEMEGERRYTGQHQEIIISGMIRRLSC